MPNDFDSPEFEGLSPEELDKLDAFLKRLGRPPYISKIYVPNLPRIRQVREAYRALKKAILESSMDAKIEWCGVDEVFFDGSVCVQIHAKMIEVDNMRPLIRGLAFADDLNIYATARSEIVMDVTFNNVYIPIL